MDRPGIVTHPGWTQNLIGAAQLAAGERVLVVVDEQYLRVQNSCASRHAPMCLSRLLNSRSRAAMLDAAGTEYL